MATLNTTIDELSSMLDNSVKFQLKNKIKARLMTNAEQVVEEVALEMAEDLMTHLELYHIPTGEIQLNLMVGPKDNPKTFKKVTSIQEC